MVWVYSLSTSQLGGAVARRAAVAAVLQSMVRALEDLEQAAEEDTLCYALVAATAAAGNGSCCTCGAVAAGWAEQQQRARQHECFGDTCEAAAGTAEGPCTLGRWEQIVVVGSTLPHGRVELGLLGPG